MYAGNGVCIDIHLKNGARNFPLMPELAVQIACVRARTDLANELYQAIEFSNYEHVHSCLARNAATSQGFAPLHAALAHCPDSPPHHRSFASGSSVCEQCLRMWIFTLTPCTHMLWFHVCWRQMHLWMLLITRETHHCILQESMPGLAVYDFCSAGQLVSAHGTYKEKLHCLQLLMLVAIQTRFPCCWAVLRQRLGRMFSWWVCICWWDTGDTQADSCSLHVASSLFNKSFILLLFTVVLLLSKTCLSCLQF